jgi:hypothetical protein
MLGKERQPLPIYSLFLKQPNRVLRVPPGSISVPLTHDGPVPLLDTLLWDLKVVVAACRPLIFLNGLVSVSVLLELRAETCGETGIYLHFISTDI